MLNPTRVSTRWLHRDIEKATTQNMKAAGRRASISRPMNSKAVVALLAAAPSFAGAAQFDENVISIPIGGTPNSIADGDFNGDGDPEIVAGRYSAASVAVSLGAPDLVDPERQEVEQTLRILGIDPGLGCTGYAVVDQDGPGGEAHLAEAGHDLEFGR